jgi:hypothetical protein
VALRSSRTRRREIFISAPSRTWMPSAPLRFFVQELSIAPSVASAGVRVPESLFPMYVAWSVYVCPAFSGSWLVVLSVYSSTVFVEALADAEADVDDALHGEVHLEVEVAEPALVGEGHQRVRARADGRPDGLELARLRAGSR